MINEIDFKNISEKVYSELDCESEVVYYFLDLLSSSVSAGIEKYLGEVLS